MEAKDTVMSKEQIERIQPKIISTIPLPSPSVTAKIQAEISFKVGYKKGVESHHECCKMDYKAGINLVVDWIKEGCGYDGSHWRHIPESAWQAKLKEWGL